MKRITESRPIRTSLPLILLLVVCSSEGLEPGAWAAERGARQDAEEAVATIGGKAITLSELSEEARAALEAIEIRHDQQLSKLELDYQKGRHEALTSTLRSLVEERLFEEESQSRGVSKESLLAEEVESKVNVTDADVNVFYQENKARMGGRTLESIASEIRLFLQEQQRQAHRRELVKVLEVKNDVLYLMEPFRVELEIEDHPTLGPATAPVTLVEFSDFECPYCDQFTATLQQLKKNYENEVRVVFRQFPLTSIHLNAQKAAEASLCAMDQGKFWEMHDLLFAERTALSVAELKEKSARLGLEQAGFDQCLDSGKHARRVAADLDAGIAVGVTGTPAIFINGQPMPNGALPYEQVAAAVDEELKRRRR